MWLFAHGRILTNAERMRRHLTSNDLCMRCQCEEEDGMHALRDCCRAKKVWNGLISAEDASNFYGLVRREWILWLLKAGNEGRGTTRWSEGWLRCAGCSGIGEILRCLTE